jgi:Cu/Ag efflux protein CusF
MARNPIVFALALSVALPAATALALTQSKTGAVKSTDMAKRVLVLASGDTFQVDSKIRLSKLKAGDKITVRYTTKDGKLVASKVTPAR